MILKLVHVVLQFRKMREKFESIIAIMAGKIIEINQNSKKRNQTNTNHNLWNEAKGYYS
jgi:hypothetical protein